MKLLLIGLGWLIAMPVFADGLSAQVLYFFQQREPHYAQNVTVDILSSTANTLSCSRPELSLPSTSRRWGTLTLSARCDQQIATLRVSVKVSGHYYRARQPIKQGARLTPDDIDTQFGPLDKLPPNSWLTPLPLPLVALQTLPAGKVLTTHQFRQPWVIKKGQSVAITFVGNGFQIGGRGTALDNAAVHQSLRIRLNNGQRVTAVVNEHQAVVIQ